MTHQEILEKALKKAIASGYSGKLPISKSSPINEWHPYGLIFNHDFAKALWGKDELTAWGYSSRNAVGSPHPVLFHEWQYHLQQMVIAEDPIAYLGENI